jgi:hypothetical protein
MKLEDTPVIKNYTPYVGDTFGRAFLIKYDGDLADLSGDTFKIRIADAITGDEFLALESGSGIENPTTGRVVWLITDEQAEDFLPNRKYKYDIQWSRSDGTVKTLQKGVMIPWKDTTPP